MKTILEENFKFSANLRIVSVFADGGSSTTFVDELPEK
jgi:hypothetical protein